jgi:hypothetical protein
MTEQPKVVGPEYLVPLIHRAVATIKADVHRRPESLPPRLLIPGSAKMLWLDTDVHKWLESCRTVKPEPEVKPKRGRPSTQLSGKL